jgi:DNA-binding response OmpR family regulator
MAIRKVLIVEDDPDIQKLIRMSLTFQGVEEIVLAGTVKNVSQSFSG